MMKNRVTTGCRASDICEVNSQCINVILTVGRSYGISIFDSVAESLQNHPAVCICKHKAEDS